MISIYENIFSIIFFVFLCVQLFATEKGSLKGCFKHESQMTKSNSVVASTSVDRCVEACIQVYHMYAALQEAKFCFCGSKYNSLEPAADNCTYVCSGNGSQTCGGVESDSVYATGLMTPSPVTNLTNSSATDTSIQIRWNHPDNVNGGFKNYKVTAQVIYTFNKNAHNEQPTDWVLPNTTFKESIEGLLPATQYNISVQPLSEFGDGPTASNIFWTEVGTPPIPPAPEILVRNNSQTMTIKLPLVELDTGPVSNYVIVVNDESRMERLDERKLKNVTEAKKLKIPYYITAELSPNEAARPFVVGDGGTYNGYLNAPFPDDASYTVILGVVSSLNGVTRSSYSLPAVFSVIFTEKSGIFETSSFHPLGRPPVNTKPNAMVVALSVAIAIGILLLIGCVVVFFLMRWRVKRNNRASDHQELTVHQTSEAASDNMGIASSVLSVNDETNLTETFENIKSQMPVILRSHLELADRVLGDGKFGAMRNGIAHRNGQQIPVLVHSLQSFVALRDGDKRVFTLELDAMFDMGVHPNTVAVIGISEEPSQLHVVVEQHQVMLKDILLESRALDYYPVYAEKHSKFSTFKEEQLMEFALGIAQGMAHLAQTKIVHGRLCSWHVRIEGTIPKITHFGLAQYDDHSEKIDYQRWSSLEALRGRYTTKGDVWSFAIVLWEICTLGATPYNTVKCKDVGGRVTRGMRLKQPNYLGDDLYQLMLQCWQIDTDERPTFSEIVSQLQTVLTNDFTNMGHLCLNLYPDFQYEKYEMELEKTFTSNGGVQV